MVETELLIIKAGHDYIRVKDDLYLRCQLDKASVFPMAKLETVEKHVQQLKKTQNVTPEIYKLILKEEPFTAS